MTKALPSTENSQKAARGRSPPRSTAKTAVQRGSRPRKTIECAEVMCCRAKAVNNGKPTTQPSETRVKERKSVKSGRRWRSQTKSTRPSKAAIVARAQVRNIGSKSATAARVAGSEPAKIATPTNPLIQPPVVFFIAPSLLSSLQLNIGSLVQQGTIQYN